MVAIVLALNCVVLVGSAMASATGRAAGIREYPRNGFSSASDVFIGPGGDLWFADPVGRIGRHTSSGRFRETDCAPCRPSRATLGPDGNIWFSDTGIEQHPKIGRMTPLGKVTEFALRMSDGPGSMDVTTGADGNLWTTVGGDIASVTTSGQITYFTPPGTTGASHITAGPDGNLWFTTGTGRQVGRLTLQGIFTMFTVAGGGTLGDIAPGPDGNLWFTDTPDRIGRITPIGTIKEFTVPTEDARPSGITAGPDGNLWFTENHAATIGRITPSGTIHEYPLPPTLGYPGEITNGPDGRLWFGVSGEALGRISTAGASKRIALPGSPAYDAAEGPDGAMWYTTWVGAASTPAIGRITTTGQTTIFRLQRDALAITQGPDGAMWFIEQAYGIGRITIGGSITEYPLPPDADPFDITAGPDGDLWFTDNNFARVGRITPTGQVKQYQVNGSPRDITTGPDGNLWFAEGESGSIGRITPTGTYKEFHVSVDSAWGITAGPDGNLWFTLSNSAGVGRLTPSGQVSLFSVPQAAGAYEITTGPDGNLWLTTLGDGIEPDGIAVVTPSGQATNVVLPTTTSLPYGITVGSDGAMWFAEWSGDKIGRVPLA